MKVLCLVLLAASLAMLPSCSGLQKVSTQQAQTATARELDPCIVLAQEKTDNLRAYGTSVSYVERIALHDAETDARMRLASMMSAAIQQATIDHLQNTQINSELSASAQRESVISEFVNAEIKNTRVIKTSIYDMSDKTVKVYVCIEMHNTVDEIGRKMGDYLSSSGVISSAKQDQENIISSFKKNLAKAKRAIAG